MITNITGDEYSICTRCYAKKSLAEFYRDNSKPNGRTSMSILFVKVHHFVHPSFAQFIKDRKILLHVGKIIADIDTIERAELYAKKNN